MNKASSPDSFFGEAEVLAPVLPTWNCERQNEERLDSRGARMYVTFAPHILLEKNLSRGRKRDLNECSKGAFNQSGEAHPLGKTDLPKEQCRSRIG